MAELSFIECTARILNDYFPEGPSYKIWAKEDLECYYAEALGLVAALRPDLSTGTCDVELKPGAVQVVEDDCCGQLIDVLGVIDASTNAVMETLSKGNNMLAKWFTKCVSGDYKPSSYQKLEIGNDTFVLNPPVPAGTTMKMRVRCIKKPDPDADLDDTRYSAAIREWVLYRARQFEQDSPTSIQMSQMHAANFFRIMNVSFEVQNLVLSGRLPNAGTPTG